MATPFCEIIDNALITIKDYKLDALYEKNPEAFVKVLTGYMLRELPKFTDCLKPLTDIFFNDAFSLSNKF